MYLPCNDSSSLWLMTLTLPPTSLTFPMGILKDTNEPNDYLSQAIKKYSNPIAWWWHHQKVYFKLSVMAFNFLSVPSKSHVVSIVISINYVYKQHQLQWDVCSHMVNNFFPSHGITYHHIWSMPSFLCLGDWSKRDLISMPEVIEGIHTSCLGKKHIHSSLKSSGSDPKI